MIHRIRGLTGFVFFLIPTRVSNTDSPLVLYNAECKSGGVQKLSGAVFCTRAASEKLTVLYQVNGESV